LQGTKQFLLATVIGCMVLRHENHIAESAAGTPTKT